MQLLRAIAISKQSRSRIIQNITVKQREKNVISRNFKNEKFRRFYEFKSYVGFALCCVLFLKLLPNNDKSGLKYKNQEFFFIGNRL